VGETTNISNIKADALKNKRLIVIEILLKYILAFFKFLFFEDNRIVIVKKKVTSCIRGGLGHRKYSAPQLSYDTKKKLSIHQRLYIWYEK